MLSFRGKTYRNWHPDIDDWITRRAPDDQEGCFRKPDLGVCPVKISSTHMDLDSYANHTRNYPTWHPNVHSYFEPYMPSSHPNVDKLLREKKPIPAGHPRIEDYVCRDKNYYLPLPGQCVSNISATHPDLDSYATPTAAYPPSHPSVQELWSAVLPSWHPYAII